MVENQPTMQETWVGSLSWEDTLEEGMATHSSILAWRIPWTEEPGRLQSIESQRVGHDSSDLTHTYAEIILMLMGHILEQYILIPFKSILEKKTEACETQCSGLVNLLRCRL